jgi:hypothetical protein
MGDRVTASGRGEDVLELPGTWLDKLHPRRNGRPGPKVTVDAKAWQTLAAWLRPEERIPHRLQKPLEAAGTASEAVAAVRHHLAGDADPLGAAVIAAVPVAQGGAESSEILADLIDLTGSPAAP